MYRATTLILTYLFPQGGSHGLLAATESSFPFQLEVGIMHTTIIRCSPMVAAAITENRERGHVHTMGAHPRLITSSPRAETGTLWSLDPSSRVLTVQSKAALAQPQVLGEVLESNQVAPPRNGASGVVSVAIACQKTPPSPVPEALRASLKQGPAYRSRLVIVPEDERPEWAARRLRAIGLAVDNSTLTVSALDTARLGGKGRGIPFVTVSSTVQVIDEDTFAQRLETGLGKGKNYGLGLIHFSPMSSK